ncbi:hypothetical protein AXF42_Ash010566 [Apostasia shenzhenica]|uniref:Protein FATTY ACID EXPORT 3, chloroplastic n=1 Tax=Apostasia shenzhenica TaxID=1088818 RepID=A0A2I0A6F3_9ASPA|nr:hypothetical protein AXF42_Ash010566 [Apostasia shenzhenica]
MASAVLTFLPPLRPSPSSHSYLAARNRRPLPPYACSSGFQFELRAAGRPYLGPCLLQKGFRGAPLIPLARRVPSLVSIAVHEESTHSDIEVEQENYLRKEPDESYKAWKQTLEIFKEEARKMKEMSQEAYELYSKRARIILMETSEILKTQANHARHHLSTIAIEISKEGKLYLSKAADKSPESLKDIVDTFASSTNELKVASAVRDFYLGIPYGAFLTIGGFLNFMLTGSISAIRFGVILGSALLALSISSLRSWKSGQPAKLSLNGQAAIAAIIFIRECRLFMGIQSIPNFVITFMSGAMLAFYIYRVIIDRSSNRGNLTESSEN